MVAVGAGGHPPQSRLLEFLQRPGEDGCGGKEGDSGIVMEDVCEDGMQNLGGRFVLMLMSAGILAGGVVVVAVGVMVVVEVGVMSFSEGRCLPVVEVECVGVGRGLVGDDALDLDGGFVAVVVETVVGDSKFEVGAVIGIVWSCVNGEFYSLWHLSQKSLEGKMCNVGGRLWCGDAGSFFDGVLFRGGDWFNEEGGGGQNGCGDG